MLRVNKTSQRQKESEERKKSFFLSLWSQTKQPLHTWVCPLFRVLPTHCHHVLSKPSNRHEKIISCSAVTWGGLDNLPFICFVWIRWQSHSSSYVFFFSRLCLVWAHFKDPVSDEQTGIQAFFLLTHRVLITNQCLHYREPTCRPHIQ